MNESPRPAVSTVSRRAVVRTAAWSVPAVSVVVATPAFAASAVARGTLTFERGESAVLPSADNKPYYDVVLAGASVSLDGPVAGVPTRLQLTVVFEPHPDSWDDQHEIYWPGDGQIPGWVSPETPGAGLYESVVLTYDLEVFPGDTVVLVGLLCGTPYSDSRGNFVLTFSAEGYEDLTVAYLATPAPPPGDPREPEEELGEGDAAGLRSDEVDSRS